MDWNEFFVFDAKTGDLIWKDRPEHHFKNRSRQLAVNRRFSGRAVLSLEKHGHKRACVMGRFYKAHRIVWEMHNGNVPHGYEIDHINGNGGDNRLENLRLATHAQNSRNTRMHKDNSIGVKGVFAYGAQGKFRARIMVDGAAIHIGVFDTIDAASAAYEDASKKFHGDFSRTS